MPIDLIENARTVEEKPDAQVAAEEAAKKNLTDPMAYLQTVPGAPTKETIEAWKAQAPNGTIHIFAPSKKRVYLVRGISGLELTNLQSRIPENLGANLPPEQRAAKIEGELQLLVAAHCVVWTNTTQDHKLTPEVLKVGSAGLPNTLFNLISWLSDFLDPDTIQLMTGEL